MNQETNSEEKQAVVANDALLAIGERLRTQDNRATADPMFCVQILICDTGYDTSYCDNQCWWNPEQMEVAYDVKPKSGVWDGPYGYKERWETIQSFFTEGGAKEYLDLDGHNVARRAHNGKIRIYADTFRRCPEMLTIRKFLLANAK